MRAQTERYHCRLERSRRRSAVALLLVLVVTAICATLAYAFVTEQSVVPQITRNVELRATARGIAESGLRLSVAYIAGNEDWRTDKSHGVWVTDASLGGGTFSVLCEDGEDLNGDSTISTPSEGDADLSDDPSDLFTLTVTGSYAGTKHIVRAIVEPIAALGDLLLVVGDDASLTTADTIQKHWIEGWGWTVTVLDDGATSSSYTTSAAASNVVFVAESASATVVGTKLTDVSTGVVLEQLSLGDEFGLTQSQDTADNRSDIDITDNTHDITSPFATGSLDVFTSNHVMHRQQDTIATGARVLGEHASASQPSLYAIETGGALFGGGSAAGRRVQLPWGQGADYAELTDDGKTILRRALEWASQGSDGALIGHWTFDDGSGSTATDSSGNAYQGTLRNMDPSSDWVTGYIGGALDFDGNNDYIELSGFPNLAGNFTITAWINPDNTYGDQRVFCDDRSNSQGFALSLGDGGSGRLRFFSRVANPISRDSSVAITSGTWQFVAGVHDASARLRRVYLGGTLIGTDTSAYGSSWGTDSGVATIGGEPDGTSEGVPQWRFGGRIDDVRVYGSALTAQQLAALAAGTADGATYTYSVHWLN